MPPKRRATGATRAEEDDTIDKTHQRLALRVGTIDSTLPTTVSATNHHGPPAKRRRTRLVADQSPGTARHHKASPQSSVKDGGGKGNNNVTHQAGVQDGQQDVQRTGDHDARVLRSKGGATRGHSELAPFFNDFDDFVFGARVVPDALNAASILYLTDDKEPAKHTLTIRLKKPSDAFVPPSSNSSLPPRSTPAPSLFPFVDLSSYEREASDFRVDPLNDRIYRKSHERGERNEKKLRNLEKERAQHERYQLERLYQELKGPDWLRTMGISGITESEKKAYEPKRDHYIRRVKALLVKFDNYREKERLLRLRKERRAARHDESGDADDEEEDDNAGNDSQEELLLDASAVQLHREATLAATKQKKQKTDKAFTSFFAKSHERAGALAKHRRGRRTAAFGHPLPEMPDLGTFHLPESIKEGGGARRSRRLDGASALFKTE